MLYNKAEGEEEVYKCDKCGGEMNEMALKWRLDMKDYDENVYCEYTLDKLDDVLSTTIYEDSITKKILFLIFLLTFTEEEQQNIILTGGSTFGKTYVANETLWYFPQDCIIRKAGASPKSFIHKQSAILIDVRTMLPIKIEKPRTKEKGGTREEWEEWTEAMRNSGYYLDYSKKILFLPDMPDTKFLKTLRPLLSHDQRIISYDVTEKKTSGLRTKEVFIKGYFTAIFATAYTEIDEQEATRHFLLSPSDDPNKIKESIELIARKNSDPDFKPWYESDPKRRNLKDRVDLINQAGIQYIYIPKDLMEELKLWFLENIQSIFPKAQRDFPRLIGIAKAWALFNFMHRKEDVVRKDIYRSIFCNRDDIKVAKNLYKNILSCNELGLTPEEYDVWENIRPHFLPDTPLSISSVHNLYFERKKRSCSDYRLRGMLKNFCRAGLLREEKDKGKWMYYPLNNNGNKKMDVDEMMGNKPQKVDSKESKINAVMWTLLDGREHTKQDIINSLHDVMNELEINKTLKTLLEEGKITQPHGYDYQKI